MLDGAPAAGDGGAVLPPRVPSTSIDQVMSMGVDVMDGQTRVVVSFRGHLDEERLARAVRLTIDAEPLLGYRFVDHCRRPYWERVDESNWLPYFRMTGAASSDPCLHAFMVDAVDPGSAPQLRVGLFREANDVLCIRSNHTFVDGGGAIRYSCLLASVYRMLGKDPDYRPAVRPAVRPGPRHVLARTGPIPAIRAVLGMRAPAAEWGIPGSGDERSRQTFVHRSVAPERLEIVRAYAREKGVTVNDVLLAAFCRSLFTMLEPPAGRRLRIEVPINLRRHLAGEQAGAIGDLSAVYFLTVDRRPGESFEGTLQRVHDDVEAMKRDRIELGEMLLLELLLLPGMPLLKGLKKLVGFNIAHPVLSNLGIVDPAAVSFGGPEIDDLQVISPTLYPPNVGVSVSTFRQRMTLSMNCCGPEADVAAFRRLLDLILDELPGAAAAGPGRP